MPEIHGAFGQAQKKENAFFIAQTLSKYPESSFVILVEGIKSLQPVHYMEHEHTCLLCREGVCLEKVDMFGWDAGMIPKVLGFSETLTSLHKKHITAQRKWFRKAAEMEMAGETDEAALLFLKQEFFRLGELYQQYIDNQNLEEEIKAKVIDTFSPRNQSLIDTLEEVKELYHKIFVIAGEKHLIEVKDMEQEPLFVAPLYDYPHNI